MARGRSRRGRLGRVLGWLALGAVVGPLLLVLVLRWVPPPTSSVMIQRALAGETVQYRWVPLEAIAPVAALAVVAAEDQKFPRHWGFDVDAIGDALDASEEGRRLRGASTISQQVVKNLFLWEGRSWLRKGLEAGGTVLVEALWPKRRILEVYLNVAEFGDNVFGVAEASRLTFGRSPAELTGAQAALLAATLPNPRRYSALLPSPYVRERQAWIQRQMARLGGPSYLAGILDD
jgi:monofunctional biosynthetic peptidoglycan transglycosylase